MGKRDCRSRQGSLSENLWIWCFPPNTWRSPSCTRSTVRTSTLCSSKRSTSRWARRVMVTTRKRTIKHGKSNLMHYKDLSESRLFDKFLVLISNWMILEKMDEKCNLSSQWDRGCTLTPKLNGISVGQHVSAKWLQQVVEYLISDLIMYAFINFNYLC